MINPKKKFDTTDMYFGVALLFVEHYWDNRSNYYSKFKKFLKKSADE